MSDENKKEELRVQADNNSIAVGNISAGGNIGDISISTGYTVDQVSILITQIQSTFQPKPFDGRCPYKGLDVFEEEDAELFFGREKLVADLVSRVKDSRTVFVTGPSGSGKSSLVRAGLIHALKQGAIKNSERWLYATMKPGRDPIGELGRVVSSLANSTNPEDEIRDKAMKDATIFARWCEIALKEGREKRLVLFIDQFEEVFTQISNEEERMVFLNLLTHAATVESGRVIILFSMRSDFVSNCATYPQLNALLNQQFVQIGAMQPDELVSAIAQPALRVGLRIDPDLIAQIINEMKGEPGALPLMQFALKDLFDSQQEKSGVPALILNDYLQRGGIHKALERHADESFSKLSKNEQELARSVFGGLIEIGRGTQDTKRTALFDELVPANTNAEDIEVIVQKLADARLITTDEQAGKDMVTLSHEKLIDAWPWLKKLVNENRDVIALQNQIVADAKEWEEHKRDASYLYAGGRLANVHEQLEKQKVTVSHLAQEFVHAGQTRQRRGQATLIGGVSAIFVLLFVAVLMYVLLTQQAQRQATIARANQLATEAFLLRQEKPELFLALEIEAFRISGAIDNGRVLELACQQAGRNLSRTEWNQYFPDETYRATCPQWPLEPEGTFAPTPNPTSSPTPIVDENALNVRYDAVAKDALSNSDDPNRVKTALDKVKAELAKDNTAINAEALKIVGAIVAKQISAEARKSIERALDLFEQSQQVNISIDNAVTFNNLCWFGSLQGYEKQVLQHCEAAVKLEPNNSFFRDSRGLARALTGDYQGAILDFQYYVDKNSANDNTVNQRKQWIEQLKKGINPFTSDVLESLKSQ